MGDPSLTLRVTEFGNFTVAQGDEIYLSQKLSG
jgi:hypothetical protein